MYADTILHPLEKSAININSRCNNILARKINFEVVEYTSNDHPEWGNPTKNQNMHRKHKINDEFGIVDSNAFQKAIDQEWSISLGITVFSVF